MKKVVLFALTAVLSFGFVGCVSSLERNWGLKEEGFGTISDLKVEVVKTADDTTRKYHVQLVYCGKTSTSYVSHATFNRMHVGQVVKLKLLLAITRDEKGEWGDKYCVAAYNWWIPNDGSGVWIVEFNEPTEHRLK